MSALADFLANSAGPLVWIEPAGYATQSFAGGKPGWLADPQPAAANLAQANSALKSRVISLDISPALFLDAPAADADDPLSVAEDVLESETGVRRALDVAKAVEHTLGAQVDLVLRIPSPAALLHRCGAPVGGEMSFDDMDDAGSALANLVRKFSEFRFAGLMLATDVNSEQAEDEFDTFGAIVSTAKHYRWLTMLRVDGALDTSLAAEANVDIVLLPQAAPGDFADGFKTDGAQLGGGLSTAFWKGEDFAATGNDSLLYGDAPGDIEPEAVLARAGSLPR